LQEFIKKQISTKTNTFQIQTKIILNIVLFSLVLCEIILKKMKKLLYISSVSLLAFTSCSNPNDSLKDPTKMLVQKVISKENDGKTYSSELIYNGNKIVRYGNIIYTYTGDVITKEASDFYTYDFVYDNEKLAYYKEHFTNESLSKKVVYTYNADGTISFKEYQIFNSAEKEVATGTLTFKDGNLVKKETLDKRNIENVTQITIKKYDTKNSLYKNILGCNLLFDDERFLSQMNNNSNNILKSTTTRSDNKAFFSDSLIKNISRFEYKYNSNDFPIVRRDFDEYGNSNYTFEYFY